jgi:hypothetical protein
LVAGPFGSHGANHHRIIGVNASRSNSRQMC